MTWSRLAIILGVAVFVLTGCGSATSPTAVTASLGAKSLPDIQLPAFIPGPLDGQSTPRALALRRPLAIIVENYDPDSRPQAGLAPASMVIETLAEDGITRFMALYLEKDAAKVGPVRSTRMYFDRWAEAFHSILAHVGGNDDAQALLWHLPKVFNIDENRWEVNIFDTGTPLFWRSTDRAAPHNMYVDSFKLRAYAVKNNQDWAYTRAYLVHKPAAPPRQRAYVATIDIDFQNPLAPQPNPGYSVHYAFDPRTDTYLREMAGVPHVDANTGKALTPANVIVMRTGPAVFDPFAGLTPQSILIPTVGTGQAWYFRDGHVQRGIWRQKNQDAPLQFFDLHSHQVAFDPGQTWVEVLPAASSFQWTSR